ncbi:hypothetical protein E2C01_056411 [Portunus trituberculatus]|uniref:Uncharacterized protein n=1 Tax=Portunus trituberculatus TaxID=210409 RepID=A0A5B7GZ31_PORTR|nr:hypothetical protein [Portunus trituberculatus]
MKHKGDNSVKLDMKEHREGNVQLFKNEETDIPGIRESLELEDKEPELVELNEKDGMVLSKEEDDNWP